MHVSRFPSLCSSLLFRVLGVLSRASYAYRLCKKGDGDDAGNVTEQCFQRGHLAFADTNVTWLQWRQTWGGDRTTTTRVAIPRVTVTDGTVPAVLDLVCKLLETDGGSDDC